jgi:hypothetical protein
MHTILSRLRLWFEAWTARPCPSDPLDAMSLAQRADLPPMHPGAVDHAERRFVQRRFMSKCIGHAGSGPEGILTCETATLSPSCARAR